MMHNRSSYRFKRNIEPMGNDSDRIYSLRPVTFNWNHDDDENKQWGLIAEEVHDTMPELALYDEYDLPFAVDYEQLPIVLLNEIQKLNKRVKHLERKVQEVKRL